MPIRIHIDLDTPEELDAWLTKLQSLVGGDLLAGVSTTAVAAAAPATTGKKGAAKKAADAPAGNAEPASTASPAAAATTAVDPFAGPTSSEANGAASQPSASSTAETTAGAPAASSPSAAAVSAEGITYDMLKDSMTALLKVKTASVAQQTLRDATGQPSLSALKPEQYKAAYDALSNAVANA